jgi:hypothetical protein
MLYVKTCVRRQNVLFVRYELTSSLVLFIRDIVLRAIRNEAEEIVDDLNIFRVYETSRGNTVSYFYEKIRDNAVSPRLQVKYKPETGGTTDDL